METARHRGRHRIAVENDMIRRREKEYLKDQMWNGAKRYFEHWEKSNNKYEAWTSPRYYEENSKMIKDIQEKKEKESNLERRREKLRKLLEEDRQTYDIELMVLKTKKFNKPPRSKPDDIPTEILKEIGQTLKIDEETKRRKEAETKLYHQWRNNNPLVRQIENKYMTKNMKLSWLDQQIEKRMQKEKEEQECKRILAEQEERYRIELENERQALSKIEEKRKKLKEDLDKQIEEYREMQRQNDALALKEREENCKKIQLEELEERRKQEERKKRDREVALYNIRQHKLKLKQKFRDIQESLIEEREFVARLRELELERSIEDEKKKLEVRRGLDEFLHLLKEQQELEVKRQKALDFIFDSEAKSVYQKQEEIWKKEEYNRKRLVDEIFGTLKHQVEESVAKNKRKQQEILQEREEMLNRIEAHNMELEMLKAEEENRRTAKKKSLDEDLKVKNARKKQQESLKLKEIDEELERIRNEEKRLQEEILKIQARQGPSKPLRNSRLFY